MKEFADILSNEHLIRFAGLFQITMTKGWGENHPQVASVRSRLNYLARIIRGGETFDIRAFQAEWTKLIADIVQADEDLSYSSEDLEWFYHLLENQRQARDVLLLLFATASTQSRWYTCGQLAKTTALTDIAWRKRAAKPGNPWLARTWGNTHVFSELILRARGIPLPSSFQDDEDLEAITDPDDETPPDEQN